MFAQNLPIRTEVRASKDAQVHCFCVNLNNVRFSDDAGRACCDDSVEPQTPPWGNPQR
jgi:hypothetical protein